jgi:hypothetical protein
MDPGRGAEAFGVLSQLAQSDVVQSVSLECGRQPHLNYHGSVFTPSISGQGNTFTNLNEGMVVQTADGGLANLMIDANTMVNVAVPYPPPWAGGDAR